MNANGWLYVIGFVFHKTGIYNVLPAGTVNLAGTLIEELNKKEKIWSGKILNQTVLKVIISF